MRMNRRSRVSPRVRGIVDAALAIVGIAVLPHMLHAQNCKRSSTGLVPIQDLGALSYKGMKGGLYPTASNTPPSAHAKALNAAATSIHPLDAQGKSNMNGRIGLLSIGMSNTTQEFSVFVERSNLDPTRRGSIRVIDGAVGGHDARTFANPKHSVWSTVQKRIQAAGLTAAQIQVAWIKQAIARPNPSSFPAHALFLQKQLTSICQNLKSMFPNMQIAFLSSRTYAGYATTNLNPEPIAYESAFSVKLLIEAQIRGDAALNANPLKGRVQRPWLAWGPLLWTDGAKGRKDGFRYYCEDTRSDGTHPSENGRHVIAQRLEAFFRTSPYAKPWYLGPGARPAAGTLALSLGCRGSRGLPSVVFNSRPSLGNSSFKTGVRSLRPSSVTVSMLALRESRSHLAKACSLWIDLTSLFHIGAALSDVRGNALLGFPIPNNKSLLGSRAYQQWLSFDAGGTLVPGLGNVALSNLGFIAIGL